MEDATAWILISARALQPLGHRAASCRGLGHHHLPHLLQGARRTGRRLWTQHLCSEEARVPQRAVRGVESLLLENPWPKVARVLQRIHQLLLPECPRARGWTSDWWTMRVLLILLADTMWPFLLFAVWRPPGSLEMASCSPPSCSRSPSSR